MWGNGMARAATLALAIGWTGVAWAEPGLANKVYSPYVKNGVTEVEVRAGRLTGGPLDGEQAAVVELERGVSDRLSLAVLAEFEQHAGDESKLDALAVEGVAYLGQIPGVGVDVGGYLEYEQRIHNESGVLEGKLLLAKQSGAFEGLLNLIAAEALTDKPGEDDTEFVPLHFELSFGLEDRPRRRGADPRSIPGAVELDCGIQLRGSIDLIERHL